MKPQKEVREAKEVNLQLEHEGILQERELENLKCGILVLKKCLNCILLIWMGNFVFGDLFSVILQRSLYSVSSWK